MVYKALSHPHQMIGSDGWVTTPTGVFGVEKPHPRFYGTYPQILGKYVREEALITLEDAFRRGTSYPAQRIGLCNRGLLRPDLNSKWVHPHRKVLNNLTSPHK